MHDKKGCVVRYLISCASPPPPFGTLSNDYKSSSVSEYRFVKRLKYETFNTFILYFETTTALLLWWSDVVEVELQFLSKNRI